MQEDMENCVNTKVVKSPNTWVSHFVDTHAAFKNWEGTQKANVEGQVARAVKEGCDNKEDCDGCSIAIARIYLNYQTYLNELFAKNFSEASEAMFSKLHEVNLQLSTAP
jgi:hypothetical protein